MIPSEVTEGLSAIAAVEHIIHIGIYVDENNAVGYHMNINYSKNRKVHLHVYEEVNFRGKSKTKSG